MVQSAPRSRQITTPTAGHSVFTGRMLFLTPNQQCQSTEAIKREGFLNCSMLCYVRQLCTVIYTQMRGVHTVIASVQDNLAKGYIAAPIVYSVVFARWRKCAPHPLHTWGPRIHTPPNGILIGSAVFVGHIVVIKTQTHTHANHATLHV